MDHFLFKREEIFSSLKKENNSCTANAAEKKSPKGSHSSKNRASPFFYCSIFRYMIEKKFLHKLLSTKRVMHNLKGREILLPPKITHHPAPPPSPPHTLNFKWSVPIITVVSCNIWFLLETSVRYKVGRR